jgi:hypothetical protein
MKKLIIIITLHASLLTLHVSEAQIIHVPADQPSIQAGINYAVSGDTVLVSPGTYFENINYNGKAITVASHFITDGDTNHINNTVIDGSQPANPDYGSVVSFFTGEDTTSVLCGFTITNGTGMVDPVYGARIGGGIVSYFAVAKIIHNKITGNNLTATAFAWGGGIACFRETGDEWIIVRNSTISNNQSIGYTGYAAGGGIFVLGNAIIGDCEISGNTCSSTQGDIYGCGINHQDINAPNDTLILRNNIIENNTGDAYNMASGGGVFSISSNCFFAGNSINYNTISGNSVFGGGMCLDESVMIEIKDNSMNHNTIHGANSYGGGVFLWHGSQVEILDNNIAYNNLTTTNNNWYGAGICFDTPLGTTLISGNHFSYNSGPVEPVGAGGAISILKAFDVTVSITSNYFFQNTAYNGGAIFEISCYNLHLKNNIFTSNKANFAGGVAMFHPATGSASVGADSRVSHPHVINNTFYSNEAYNQGGAVRFQGTFNVPEILNCIFWNNTAPTGKDIYNLSGISMQVSYSDIETELIIGPWTGIGNIHADPQFMSPDPYCHITASSPCRDTGTINFNTPIVDFDGDSRPDPVSNLMDMGADEFYAMPDPPVALDPDEIGNDYFEARWEESAWAQRYYLDVSEDPDFVDFVEGYENLDVGNVTSYLVEGLDPIPYYYRIRAHNSAGVSENSNVISVLSVNTDEFKIHPSADGSEFKIDIYPNPSWGISHFTFHISQYQWVTLKVFDLHGREVAVVLDEMLPAGEHVVSFDAGSLPPGVYIIRESSVVSRQSSVVKLIKF